MAGPSVEIQPVASAVGERSVERNRLVVTVGGADWRAVQVNQRLRMVEDVAERSERKVDGQSVSGPAGRYPDRTRQEKVKVGASPVALGLYGGPCARIGVQGRILGGTR